MATPTRRSSSTTILHRWLQCWTGEAASGVHFAGGPNERFQRFLAGYAGLIPLDNHERVAIPGFCGLRWAMQAVHFARRIRHGTAFGGDAKRQTRRWYDGYNECGLRVARRTLEVSPTTADGAST
jgi:Ser/Thr protein kinase RdoA (MazF antagonist)